METRNTQEKLDNFLNKLNESVINPDEKIILSINPDTVNEELEKAYSELEYIDSKLTNKPKNMGNIHTMDYLLEKLKVEFDIPDYMILCIQEVAAGLVIEQLIRGIDVASKHYARLERAITKKDYEDLMFTLFPPKEQNDENPKIIKFPTKK